MSRDGMEVREVDLEEAKLILEDADRWGSIIVDAETREVVWEIAPHVREIEIIGMMLGGG